MDPGNAGQRLRGAHRPDAEGGLLAVDSGIDIVDGYPVAGRVRQRCRHHMPVIGIGQGFGPSLADAEGTHRHARIHIGIVFRGGPVQRRQRGVGGPAGHGDRFAADPVLHGKHRQPGIGFLPPVILQVHVFPQREVRGIFVVAVPLPRAEVIEIPQLDRNGLEERDLGLESQVVAAAFPDGGPAADLQGLPLGRVDVPDQDFRSVSRPEQRLAGDGAVLPGYLPVGHIPEFVDRRIGLNGYINGAGIEIQRPALLFHTDAPVFKAYPVLAEIERHLSQILSVGFAGRRPEYPVGRESRRGYVCAFHEPWFAPSYHITRNYVRKRS